MERRVFRPGASKWSARSSDPAGMDTMVCTWIERDEIFEGYVRDALGPDDRDAFEEHFFTCKACFDKLQTYRALQAELRATAGEVAAPQPVRVRPRWWVPLAAAAGLILIAALTMWLRGSSPPAPESTSATAPAPQIPTLTPASPAQPSPAPATGQTTRPASPSAVPIAVLARVDPPIYLPLSLRGPRDEAAERFGTAMTRYAEKDYAGAIPDLRAAVGLNPKAPHALFFLAICELLTSHIDPAVEGLQKTIALGESPYLEEAHFYLAKARLRQNRLQDARDELTRTVERRGRLERGARQLLAQLDALIASKTPR
jgi:hypothetical protein